MLGPALFLALVGAPAPEAAVEVPSNAPRSEVPAPRVDRSTLRVAVGLSPDAPGTDEERAWLDKLENSAKSSTQPPAEVRRLRAGAAPPGMICREGRDDLVIVVGYLPEDPAPRLFAQDCRLDESLSIQSIRLSESSDIVALYWDEHLDRVAAGAQERRLGALDPRAKRALVIGGAAILLGGAVALAVVSALRRDTVVLTVSPR